MQHHYFPLGNATMGQLSVTLISTSPVECWTCSVSALLWLHGLPMFVLLGHVWPVSHKWCFIEWMSCSLDSVIANTFQHTDVQRRHCYPLLLWMVMLVNTTAPGVDSYKSLDWMFALSIFQCWLVVAVSHQQSSCDRMFTWMFLLTCKCRTWYLCIKYAVKTLRVFSL
jgi:hypothetical protein